MSEYDRIETRKTDFGTVKWLITDRGTKYANSECERRLKSAVRAMQRWFSRTLRTMTEWDELDMREVEIERIRWILDDIASYVEIVQRELDKLEGVNKQDDRIAKLRALAADSAATEGEAAAAAEAIARIERRYSNG